MVDRRHYISDKELAESCDDLEMTPEEYLKQNVIPQKGEDRMAGTARSNGISEILFSDLLEFVYDLEVPRCRMDNMYRNMVRMLLGINLVILIRSQM